MHPPNAPTPTRTRARPCVQVPGSCKAFEDVALKALEDVATWMGVADEAFRLSSYQHRPAEEEGSSGKGPSKQLLSLVAALHKGSRAPTEKEPVQLGTGVIEEFTAGRLAGGLGATCKLLDVAAVPITMAAVRVPPKEELDGHMPPMADLEGTSRLELKQTLAYMDHLSRARRESKATAVAAGVPSEVVRETAVRLISSAEIGFFPKEIVVDPERKSRTTSPVQPEEAEALRQAILADPTALAAASTLSAVGIYEKAASYRDGGAARSPPRSPPPSQPSAADGKRPDDKQPDEEAPRPLTPKSQLEALEALWGAEAGEAEAEAEAAPAAQPTDKRPDGEQGTGYRVQPDEQPPASAGEQPDGGAADASPRPASRGLGLGSTALSTFKGRMSYVKMRRDNLVGTLNAIEQLRAGTVWTELRAPSSGALVDPAWNLGK